MNKPIRTVAIFCLVLFLALMVNVTWTSFFKADDYNSRADNRRVQEFAFDSPRGAILVRRTPIADSELQDGVYQRSYTTPFLYAPVTGFFSFGSSTGIEQSQNTVLSGEDPRLFLRSLTDLVSNEPPRGGNVQLTLDPAAQRAAYDALEDLGPEAEGAVVALEPSTGRILAMASYPSYDPNRLADRDLDNRDDVYAELLDNPRDPLVNRAVATRLFPGSTFKVVTAAAALESGQYEGPDALVPGGASFQLPNTTGDAGLVDNGGRSCGSGEITLRQAMEQSCNTTFAQLAINVGSEAMLEQAERFGFNSDYLEDLDGQVQSVYPTEIDAAQTGQTGFGQYTVQATPLQMAMVAAGIANEGVVMRPYLVEQVQSADYDEVEQTDPEQLSEAISPETAATLTEVMVSTVDNGTASTAAIDGVSVAGKTGTAERGGDLPDYAWFISFAPDRDADVAVAVMIEAAPGQSIGGGSLGGPIAKAVMEAVLP